MLMLISVFQMPIFGTVLKIEISAFKRYLNLKLDKCTLDKYRLLQLLHMF